MRSKIDPSAPQLERREGIDEEIDINQATDDSSWDSEDWEQFDQLIENCLVDTEMKLL